MDHYSFATGANMAYTGDALALVALHNKENYPSSSGASDSAAAEVESTLA